MEPKPLGPSMILVDMSEPLYHSRDRATLLSKEGIPLTQIMEWSLCARNEMLRPYPLMPSGLEDAAMEQVYDILIGNQLLCHLDEVAQEQIISAAFRVTLEGLYYFDRIFTRIGVGDNAYFVTQWSHHTAVLDRFLR